MNFKYLMKSFLIAGSCLLVAGCSTIPYPDLPDFGNTAGTTAKEPSLSKEQQADTLKELEQQKERQQNEAKGIKIF